MDVWMTDSAEGKAKPDSSPGHVVHYYLDTSDCFGSEWDWEQISRRLGYSYVADWGDMARDLVTLGIPTRPWDRVKRTPGQEIFGFFNVKEFEADKWKNEYPNAAFSRMTERDGAWMARILAHFTPNMIDGLAGMGKFSDPAKTAYLASVLKGRLDKILNRYLTRLSPLAGARVEGTDRLCAEDLAETRLLRQPAEFRYSAQLSNGTSEKVLSVARQPGGRICVSLPHVGEAGSRDDAREHYLHVTIADGVAQGPLVVHLYNLGSERGYRLAGIERPEP